MDGKQGNIAYDSSGGNGGDCNVKTNMSFNNTDLGNVNIVYTNSLCGPVGGTCDPKLTISGQDYAMQSADNCVNGKGCSGVSDCYGYWRCCFTPSQNGQPPQPANATALATVTTVSTYSKYAVSTFSSSFCNLNVDGPTCWLTMTTSTVTGCTASFGGIVGNQPVPCETAYATSAFYSISSGIPSTFSAPSPSSSVSSSTTVSSSTASYMGISASSTLLSSPSPRGSTPTPASFPKIDGASTQRQGTSKAGESRFGTPYQRPTPYFAKPSQLTSKSGGKSKSSTLPVSKGFARTPTGLAY